MNPNRNTSTWQELALLTDPREYELVTALDNEGVAAILAQYPKPWNWSGFTKSWRFLILRKANIDAYKPIQSPDRLTTAEDLVAAMNC